LWLICFFVLDAGKGNEAFVDPLFFSWEKMEDGGKMEDGSFRSGGKTFVDEDYLNYEGSDDILYDFGPSSGGNVQPLETEEEDVEILKIYVGSE